MAGAAGPAGGGVEVQLDVGDVVDDAMGGQRTGEERDALVLEGVQVLLAGSKGDLAATLDLHEAAARLEPVRLLGRQQGHDVPQLAHPLDHAVAVHRHKVVKGVVGHARLSERVHAADGVGHAHHQKVKERDRRQSASQRVSRQVQRLLRAQGGDARHHVMVHRLERQMEALVDPDLGQQVRLDQRRCGLDHRLWNSRHCVIQIGIPLRKMKK